jgi:hypothetical protein
MQSRLAQASCSLGEWEPLANVKFTVTHWRQHGGQSDMTLICSLVVTTRPLASLGGQTRKHPHMRNALGSTPYY